MSSFDDDHRPAPVPQTATRIWTDIDRFAERYLGESARLDSLAALEAGLDVSGLPLPDFSPEGNDERDHLRRTTRSALAGLDPRDAEDVITTAALDERLRRAISIHEIGDSVRLDVVVSPVQQLRDCFDLLPLDTFDDWELAAGWLRDVPRAVQGYIRSLEHMAATRPDRVAARQVEAVAAQSDAAAGSIGSRLDPDDAPPPHRAGIERARGLARQAYRDLSAAVHDVILPNAKGRDAVGPERYAAHLEWYLGSSVDLDDAYHWGVDEVARIKVEMRDVSHRIRRGATPDEARSLLRQDVRYALRGEHELVTWMQATADQAIDALDGEAFDIPPALRRLECRVAPASTGVISYTAPSEDLRRPGQMWWSVPDPSAVHFSWQERTTVYHEGVPGHHLQIGGAAYQTGHLNRWRRLGGVVDGCSEGWALYAERLMAELGFLDDPADRLGMLYARLVRAARVVIDIGWHCGLPTPAERGGGPWSWEAGWQYLTDNSTASEHKRRFELLRYLGIPGQAPVYALGERCWLDLKEVALAGGEDARTFHRRALDVGSVGLDVLRLAVTS
ncbi:MAG: DUF885 domain-containing protein [Dermatophilaceae bacterium]